MNKYPKLYPGDIAGVKGKGVLAKLQSIFVTPKTDRFHHFLIGDYIEDDDDYVILESINKGIAVGRLSFYKPEDIEIYRLDDPYWMEIGKKAAQALTWYGRSSYDYMLIIKLFLSIPYLIMKCGMPPWVPEQIPYGRDNSFVCTEAAAVGYADIDHRIIPKGVIPMPASFKQALDRGVIKRIFP